MDKRTIGLLITGFGTKLIAVGVVIWGATYVLHFIQHAFDPINRVLGN